MVIRMEKQVQVKIWLSPVIVRIQSTHDGCFLLWSLYIVCVGQRGVILAVILCFLYVVRIKASNPQRDILLTLFHLTRANLVAGCS